LSTTKDLTIAGPGANGITVSGNHASRVFSIGAAFTVDISGMTIANGLVATGSGGGILNAGTLTVTSSTLSGNSARIGPGGGIWNFASGPMNVTNSTLSGNSAALNGGGIDTSGKLTHFRNTIIAGNTAPTAPDLAGDLGSQGFNLIGNTSGSSGFDATDLLNVDARLDQLQDHGGPTQTMALLPGSPALNAGDPAQLGGLDQRGVVRSGGVNIGAYQASASAFVLSAPAMVTSGVPFDLTVTAIDTFGQTAVGYTGTVTFSTTDSDPNVVLPADYPFALGDGGSYTFTDTGLGETTLVTPGEQVITAADTADDTITGSATITVNGTGPGRHTNQERNPAALSPMALARLFGSDDRSLWDARAWAVMGEAVALAHRGMASQDNALSL
jgi:hypothetical protein